MGSLVPLLFVAVIQTMFEHEFYRCFSGDYKCRHCAGDVWGMVEERNLQLAPPPGVQALDPLLQLQQNLAALNQVRILTLSFSFSRTSPLLNRSEF
jgi:hypothetical protein